MNEFVDIQASHIASDDTLNEALTEHYGRGFRSVTYPTASIFCIENTEMPEYESRSRYKHSSGIIAWQGKTPITIKINHNTHMISIATRPQPVSY